MFGLTAIIGVLALALVLVVPVTAPGAESAEQFYRDKTVTLVAAAGRPGTSTDLMARLLAPILARELGAKVMVENRGSAEGVNYVYNRAKPDGLTLLVKDTNTIQFNDLLDAPGADYELDKFNFIADVLPQSNLFGVSPKSPYQTLDDLRKAKGLKAGGTSARGNLVVSAAIMAEILGLDCKVISGYKSRKLLVLAIARQEIDLTAGVTQTGAYTDQKGGYVNYLFTHGRERSSLFPDLPTLFELGVKIPKGLEDAYGLVDGTGKTVSTPPGVSQEKVAYLRNLFSKISEDKEVQTKIKEIAKAWHPFIPGKEVQEEMAALKKNRDLGRQIESIVHKFLAVQ
jgi:tripartite-type tricarboxylate transporter receptor subunit TctC